MEISHLRNSDEKIVYKIERELENCTSFSIASAFVDVDAIKLLEYYLEKNKQLKKGRFLIGIYKRFNKKAVLKRLNQIAKKYSEKIEVRVSKNNQFHWKFYHFKSASQNNLYVGSSNFTKGGLKNNSELLLKVSYRNNDKKQSLDNLLESFNEEFDDEHSCPITKCNIENYEESKPPSSSGNKSRGKGSFFPKSKRSSNGKRIKNGNAIVLYLPGLVKRQVVKEVLDIYPSWLSRERDFFVYDQKQVFEKCKVVDEILILSGRSQKTYQYLWCNYMGSDIIKTNEGKYFVSYSFVKPDKKLTQSQLRALKEAGIHLAARNKPFYHKVLGKNQYQYLRKILV